MLCNARLKRLERLPPAVPHVPAWQQDAWVRLMSTLSAEHARVIEAETDALCAWLDAGGDGHRPPTPLSDEAFRRVDAQDARLTGAKGPLALPPAVADVYLTQSGTFLYQRCRD